VQVHDDLTSVLKQRQRLLNGARGSAAGAQPAAEDARMDVPLAPRLPPPLSAAAPLLDLIDVETTQGTQSARACTCGVGVVVVCTGGRQPAPVRRDRQ